MEQKYSTVNSYALYNGIHHDIMHAGVNLLNKVSIISIISILLLVVVVVVVVVVIIIIIRILLRSSTLPEWETTTLNSQLSLNKTMKLHSLISF